MGVGCGVLVTLRGGKVRNQVWFCGGIFKVGLDVALKKCKTDKNRGYDAGFLSLWGCAGDCGRGCTNMKRLN